MRNKLISRLTIASMLGVGAVALVFACDNTMPTPTPTPTPDMAVIPPDMTLLNPAISTITPKQGPTTGGTAITITGTNFKSTATVKIGGIAATGVSVNGNTITATTAASTNVGPQDVVVDNGDGSTAATLAKGYNYFIGTLTFPAGANANTAVLNVNGPRGLSNIDLVGQGFPSIVTAMGTANVMGVAMTGINVIPNSTTASTPNPPTFTTTTGIPTVATANTISTAVGDLDGNGLQDVVVTNQAQNSVTVIFRTMATPPFTAVTIPTATGSFNQPSFAAIGDFDADGKVNDIAVTNAGNGTVSILKYNGNMAFVAGAGSPVNITTGTSGYTPYSVETGDFDKDGRTDLAVGNVANNGNLRVLLNKAAGWTAGSLITTAPANMPNVVKTGDFNGDGNVDLAVISRQNPGVLTMYKGDGAGGFTTLGTAVTLTANTNPEIAAVGDLNLDGNLDLVIPGMGSSNAHIMLGKGDGTFTIFGNGATATGIAQCNGVAIGDYNKDGKPDVAMSSFTTGNVLIFRNTGT